VRPRLRSRLSFGAGISECVYCMGSRIKWCSLQFQLRFLLLSRRAMRSVSCHGELRDVVVCGFVGSPDWTSRASRRCPVGRSRPNFFLDRNCSFFDNGCVEKFGNSKRGARGSEFSAVLLSSSSSGVCKASVIGFTSVDRSQDHPDFPVLSSLLVFDFSEALAINHALCRVRLWQDEEGQHREAMRVDI